MTTSIVIPAWCWDEPTLKMAEKSLRNVRETTVSDQTEVIVVYSGIEEGEERLTRLCDRFIRIEPRQGWASSVNHGMIAAVGGHICVGSTDVRLPEGWLPVLLEDAGHDGIASPLDYKADGETRRRWDKTMRGSFWGAWYLFPRRILETIGLLDAYVMRRMADMDWAIRARKVGFRTVRSDVKARHIAPHHVLNAFPDPYDALVRASFMERHGADRLGSWEGLPRATE